MRKQTRHRLQIVCGLGILFLLAFVLLIGLTELKWVGSTNLTIEFIVTDAETGEPVKDANLAILSYGGFYEDGRRLQNSERKEEELKFTTNETGVASYVCRQSMCFGTSSLFKNTYCVHLPYWYVTVGAAGYTTNEPFSLDELPYRRAVKRVGPQQAKLVVPIALHKSRP